MFRNYQSHLPIIILFQFFSAIPLLQADFREVNERLQTLAGNDLSIEQQQEIVDLIRQTPETQLSLIHWTQVAQLVKGYEQCSALLKALSFANLIKFDTAQNQFVKPDSSQVLPDPDQQALLTMHQHAHAMLEPPLLYDIGLEVGKSINEEDVKLTSEELLKIIDAATLNTSASEKDVLEYAKQVIVPQLEGKIKFNQKNQGKLILQVNNQLYPLIFSKPDGQEVTMEIDTPYSLPNYGEDEAKELKRNQFLKKLFDEYGIIFRNPQDWTLEEVVAVAKAVEKIPEGFREKLDNLILFRAPDVKGKSHIAGYNVVYHTIVLRDQAFQALSFVSTGGMNNSYSTKAIMHEYGHSLQYSKKESDSIKRSYSDLKKTQEIIKTRQSEVRKYTGQASELLRRINRLPNMQPAEKAKVDKFVNVFIAIRRQLETKMARAVMPNGNLLKIPTAPELKKLSLDKEYQNIIQKSQEQFDPTVRTFILAAVAEYQKAIMKYNDSVALFNGFHRQLEQIKNETQTPLVMELKARIERRGISPNLTPYVKESWEKNDYSEFYAEAFALFNNEPDLLKRSAPELYNTLDDFYQELNDVSADDSNSEAAASSHALATTISPYTHVNASSPTHSLKDQLPFFEPSPTPGDIAIQKLEQTASSLIVQQRLADSGPSTDDDISDKFDDSTISPPESPELRRRRSTPSRGSKGKR